MKFKYRLKIFVDETTARRASMTPEVVRKLRSTGTRLFYSSGIMTLESKENHDIDEDLVKAVVKAIGKPVEAMAEIEVNGRSKEVFRGIMNPLKPLGILKSETEEEEGEEEVEEVEEDVEEELFLDEEDMDEEELYFGFRSDDDDEY